MCFLLVVRSTEQGKVSGSTVLRQALKTLLLHVLQGL